MTHLESLNTSISEDPAVTIYFQNDACQPCKILRPKVKELLAEKYPKMKLHLIDPIREPECSAAFQVFSLPTILIFFDGKESFRGGIYTSIVEMDESINRYYKMLFED